MTIPGDPLVTVYVTNYNYGRYVRQALDSVLAQTFDDYELLIIDDGSTDDSRDIIGEYRGHPKVSKVIFQENMGLNRTNNVALEASRGRYIIRLDADDFLDPNALLVLTTILNSKPDLGLVFPDYYYVDSSGQVVGQERRHDFSQDVSLLDQPAHGACTLIRKAALLEVGGYSENYRCQDGYDLWLRFIEKFDVNNVNLPLFYYRRHGENLTQNHRLILDTRAQIMKDHVERAKRAPIDVLGLVPVRGPGIEPGNPVLEDLGGKAVLDWSIEAALEAEGVKGVILSTPDQEVRQHVQRRYGNSVLYHERPPELARENVQLDRTMADAISSCDIDFEPGAYLTLYAEHPFRSAMFLEKAVNTMRIFDTDSVIGVVPETDAYFQHDGTGLKEVGNNNRMNTLRVERERLYRMTGGIQVVRSSFYHMSGRRLGGVVGQIVLDPLAAVRVSDNVELETARVRLRLAKEAEGSRIERILSSSP